MSETISETPPSAFSLSKATLQAIDEVMTHYPDKRSAVLPLLHLIQEEQGYLSRPAIEWVAEKLELQPINVWEVVTFYPMFREKPVGRKHIKVCRTLSCALTGSHKTCAVLQEKLGCGLDEVSADGEFSIEYSECLASCGSGPVLMVNDEFLENVTEEKAAKLAERLCSETPSSHG